MIATSIGLTPNRRQVRVDCGDGSRMRAKADQLRMLPVPSGSTSQHGSSQQAFSPEGDEASGIEMRGIQRPKPHGARRYAWKLMISPRTSNVPSSTMNTVALVCAEPR